jgi:DNA-directed RNA polymerase sigma subunit (sigma70/sigma32)
LNQSDKMTERELLILKMRFGIDMPNQETWTLHQIAKLFTISYERVRQIEVRA